MSERKHLLLATRKELGSIFALLSWDREQCFKFMYDSACSLAANFIKNWLESLQIYVTSALAVSRNLEPIDNLLSQLV